MPLETLQLNSQHLALDTRLAPLRRELSRRRHAALVRSAQPPPPQGAAQIARAPSRAQGEQPELETALRCFRPLEASRPVAPRTRDLPVPKPRDRPAHRAPRRTQRCALEQPCSPSTTKLLMDERAPNTAHGACRPGRSCPRTPRLSYRFGVRLHAEEHSAHTTSHPRTFRRCSRPSRQRCALAALAPARSVPPERARGRIDGVPVRPCTPTALTPPALSGGAQPNARAREGGAPPMPLK